MRFQRRDVDFECLWNVATLISNVATLENFLCGMSRRCPERRDVALNVTTLFCLRPKTPHCFALTLPSSYLNPSVLCRAPTQPLPESTSSPVEDHSIALRHPLHLHCHHLFPRLPVPYPCSPLPHSTSESSHWSGHPP